MAGRFSKCGVITLRRTCAAVALVAAVVYGGTLRNAFALDDGHIILGNALVHNGSGIWRAFLTSYWPPAFGGFLYRPLPVATFALDWQVGGPAWFHFVNVLWHALSSVLVVLLAARWTNLRAALLAGLVFAVHPVHVEAVANIVSRSELMATAFTLAGVYVAVELDRPWLSAALWGLGLLSKESAGVAPLLVALAWWAGVGRPRPPVRRAWLFAGAWGVAAALYLTAAAVVLHGSVGSAGTAPVFVGHSPVAVRLTAVAELVDLFRLLLVPITLRVDYSPDERTIVPGILDGRFLSGVLVLALWAVLVVVAWRRRRRVEAVGLAWIGIAYIPVSNLIVPIGILMAERTLYLPSAGLALALGAAAGRLPARPLALGAALVILAGAVRTVERVPVWRDNLHVVLSLLEDSPRSYQGPMASAGVYLEAGQPEKALEAAGAAASIFPLDPRPYLIGAHAALKIGRVTTADSLLALADRHCAPCAGVYEAEIAVARSLRDSAIADSLQSHLRRLGRSLP
jgi:hypothetical protein